MLNENLTHGELALVLGEYIDRINFILGEIDSQVANIINDKKLLGILHHALNISNYKKSDFRYTLLKRARKSDLEKFLRQVNLIDVKFETKNVEKIIREAARLSWGNNEQTLAFVEIFGYEKNLIPKESEPIPPQEVCRSYGDPLKTLKDYQTDIFFRSLRLVVDPWSRFIVKMPTGAGKTRTTIETVCHFLKDENQNGFEQVVWIADKEELCEQAVSSIKHVWPHIGQKNLNIYRLWGSRKHDKFNNPSFIVATYQTLHSLLKKNSTLFPEPHLIITDEAHNVSTPTHKQVLDKLVKHKTRIIGLTATPMRKNSLENKDLMNFFNEQIIEINSGEQNAIDFLQGRGYLAHCIPISIPSHREYRLTMEQRKELEEIGDLPADLLDKIAKDDKRNIIIVEQLLELNKEGRQVLYFAPSVEQSKFMCMLLLTKGVNAAHVDGTTPIEYRRDVVAKFKDKTINFIFNFDVFPTGFDAPNIDVVFIARPTKSLVLHQQMIGRGMRGPKMGGTAQFKLYRVVDNMPEIDLADEYFSNIWKYLDE